MKKSVRFLMFFILVLQTGLVFSVVRKASENCCDDDSVVYERKEPSGYLCHLKERGKVFNLYYITDKNDLCFSSFGDLLKTERENCVFIGVLEAATKHACGFVMFKQTEQKHVWRITDRVFPNIVTRLAFSILEIDFKTKKIIMPVQGLTSEDREQWQGMGFIASDCKVPEEYEDPSSYTVLEWNCRWNCKRSKNCE